MSNLLTSSLLCGRLHSHNYVDCDMSGKSLSHESVCKQCSDVESRMNWIGKTGLRFCLLSRRTFCSHEIVLHDEKDGAPKRARFFLYDERFCSHEIVLHDEKDGAPKRARFLPMMTRMMMSMMTMMMIPTFSFKIQDEIPV